MVTAIVQQVHLAATSSAFAAFWSGEGGRVVVWGDPCNGGDLSDLEDGERGMDGELKRGICP